MESDKSWPTVSKENTKGAMQDQTKDLFKKASCLQ